MIEVFRIEHQKLGIGPFQFDDEFTQFLAENTTGPFPHNDGLPLHEIPWTYRFGCLSVQSLREWFDLDCLNFKTTLRKLDQLGFVLKEYLVEDGDYIISDSGKQVCFSVTYAKSEGLVETHKVTKLIEV